MSVIVVEVKVNTAGRDGQKLLVPVGITTAHQMPLHFAVTGGRFSLSCETTTGQMAAVIQPEGGSDVTLAYRFGEMGLTYPDNMFQSRPSRFTRAAEALVADARRTANLAADGHAAIATIVAETAEKFTYGHVDVRFNDGLDVIPHLGCGLTKGSCVDINTYLIASLRSAGFEAGYVTGYFFPVEKNGTCSDMHCWVVTRHDGVVLEWDIAHHMKMGKKEICCGLNPKPGQRVAMAHSMGLDFPELGVVEAKLLAEPVWVGEGGALYKSSLEISMRPEEGSD
ncbi:transglutaminase-like domain-containing protein [Roseibium algae]|uniref:Transglutaminase-like domain-containing protein n=1 Tax=Roseibium algae TaxID=3123038 RepID=A0ABU8TFG1_9HYPH